MKLPPPVTPRSPAPRPGAKPSGPKLICWNLESLTVNAKNSCTAFRKNARGNIIYIYVCVYIKKYTYIHYITLHCIALHCITLHYIHTYIHVCVCEITLYEFLLSQLIVASSQRLSRVISRSVQFSCSFSTQHQRILHTAPSSPQTTMAPEHSWHLSWPNCNFPRFTPASSLYSIFTEISPLRIHHFIPVQRPSRHSKPWF